MPCPRAASLFGVRLTMKYDTTLRSTASPTRSSIEPRRTLLSVLRDDLGLTGTKEGCNDSECGACMVLLDGEPLNSCSYLAVQADGPRGDDG